MDIIFILIAIFIVGGFLAIQGPINNLLAVNYGRSTLVAVSVSFLIGAVLLLIIAMLFRIPLPQLDGSTTWWHWTGGILGATYVTIVAWSVVRLGSATTMTLILLGQILTSVVLDQFGWLGMAVHPTSWQRTIGVVLVFAGAYLVRKTKKPQGN